MSLCCECCVMWGCVLCEESYLLWYVPECDREASTMRWPRSTRGLRAMSVYTLISFVPKLRTGQPVFGSWQNQWSFHPSEHRPASYPLYSKDEKNRHEITAQNVLEWRPCKHWHYSRSCVKNTAYADSSGTGEVVPYMPGRSKRRTGSIPPLSLELSARRR